MTEIELAAAEITEARAVLEELEAAQLQVDSRTLEKLIGVRKTLGLATWRIQKAYDEAASRPVAG